MEDDARVFSLHYFGKRFSNNRIPVEALPDLPAFRDLLLSFAKDEWRARHPDRQKLPRNFDKELVLSLFAIEDGSAIPKLEWKRSDPQALLFEIADEFDDIVEAAYANVVVLFDGGETETPHLNSEKLRALNRFGAALKEGEKIELAARDESGKVVWLDMHRRKQLIMGGRETYQTRIEGTGELVGNDSPSDPNGQCSIRVQTEQYGTISIPVDRLQLYEEFAEALNSEVQFELLVELDQNDKLRSVVDVFDVATISDPNGTVVADAKSRLEELQRLEDGWHDGAGLALGRAALARALDFVVATRTSGVDMHIFPTEVGGVLVDFLLKGWEYSVEFDRVGKPEMYGIEVSGSGEMEPTSFGGVDDVIEEFRRRLSANG
ncbi:hypothetical protein [Altererythrobacter sp. Root672]|uniref:hypothetical protein n=1 Tax=Altererythrobacter sp. Root672 TaxID=1736584 RepID=UPI000AEA82ED|nr:hypothetical protein [Altererythrobacter sp. Root672]